jgi:hypothetical protein
MPGPKITQKPKVYRVENITIVCDETCPIYYCNEPCRVRNHVEKYSKIIRMGYECSML